MIEEIVVAIINDCLPNIDPKEKKNEQTGKISTEVPYLAPMEPGKFVHLSVYTP